MKTIEISEGVWDFLEVQSKFHESPNDVLERLFQIQRKSPVQPPKPQVRVEAKSPFKHPFANIKMSAEIRNKILHVAFETGPADKWPLPHQSDKAGIRRIRDLAVKFAKENGASFGQEQAVKKALTNAGYWLVK